MFRTNNPTLRNPAFAPTQTWDSAFGRSAPVARPTTMTIAGTVRKSLFLLTLCSTTAIISWSVIATNTALLMPVWGVGALTAFVLGLVLFFKPTAAPFVAPVYAIAEGAVVGGLSLMWASYARGSHSGRVSALGTDIVIQAAVLTFGIAACMLIAYATRLVRPRQWMLTGIIAATGGVCLFSFVMFVLSWIMPGTIMGLWQSPLGLVIAGGVVVIATLNFILDFAVIENGVSNGAPKYMEWYSGYCLLVTIVWLYISLLRFLALLNRRN